MYIYCSQVLRFFSHLMAHLMASPGAPRSDESRGLATGGPCQSSAHVDLLRLSWYMVGTELVPLEPWRGHSYPFWGFMRLVGSTHKKSQKYQKSNQIHLHFQPFWSYIATDGEMWPFTFFAWEEENPRIVRKEQPPKSLQTDLRWPTLPCSTSHLEQSWEWISLLWFVQQWLSTVGIRIDTVPDSGVLSALFCFFLVQSLLKSTDSGLTTPGRFQEKLSHPMGCTANKCHWASLS